MQNSAIFVILSFNQVDNENVVCEIQRDAEEKCQSLQFYVSSKTQLIRYSTNACFNVEQTVERLTKTLLRFLFSLSLSRFLLLVILFSRLFLSFFLTEHKRQKKRKNNMVIKKNELLCVAVCSNHSTLLPTHTIYIQISTYIYI